MNYITERKMEVVREGRSSTGSREVVDNSEMMRNKVKLVGASSSVDRHPYFKLRHREHDYDELEQQHPRNRSVKMFNRVQVVYYLTRHGHLEHPHFLEVSHLATQPLRLRDVLERLTLLRGKAMSTRYSWSCKRSYKNGYVWNDLSENDVIYASDGSEYILKGSELVSHTDITEIRAQELQLKGREQRRSSEVKTLPNGLVIRTAVGHSFRQTAAVAGSNTESRAQKYFEQSHNNEDDDEEKVEDDEEEKGSCNSSNPPYPALPIDECPLIMQTEHDESYSLPSTSSTNSDKLPTAPPPPPLPPPPATPCSVPSKQDGDPYGLIRNPVLQLIACGGGSIAAKSKTKTVNGKASNSNGNGNSNNSSSGSSNNSFTFDTMRTSIMPCFKHQLSIKGGSLSDSASLSMCNARTHSSSVKDQCPCSCKTEERRVNKEVDDEDMIMVRYMSENPRFGNLQSQEKEYFSGTLVETMPTYNLQHTPSSALAQQSQPPVFTKSSSYNERSSKSGLQAAAAEEQDNEKDSVKMKGFIKCIPRRKSCGSTSSKSNKL